MNFEFSRAFQDSAQSEAAALGSTEKTICKQNKIRNSQHIQKSNPKIEITCKRNVKQNKKQNLQQSRIQLDQFLVKSDLPVNASPQENVIYERNETNSQICKFKTVKKSS